MKAILFTVAFFALAFFLLGPGPALGACVCQPAIPAACTPVQPCAPAISTPVPKMPEACSPAAPACAPVDATCGQATGQRPHLLIRVLKAPGKLLKRLVHARPGVIVPKRAGC